MLSPEQSNSAGGRGESSGQSSERRGTNDSAEKEAKEGKVRTAAAPIPRTLHEARPLWVSLLCLFGLLANVALTLYSHLGVTAEVLTDAPVDEAPNCSAAAASALGGGASNLTGACLNAADSALWDGGLKYTNWEDMNSCGMGCGIRTLSGPTCVQECE